MRLFSCNYFMLEFIVFSGYSGEVAHSWTMTQHAYCLIGAVSEMKGKIQ